MNEIKSTIQSIGATDIGVREKTELPGKKSHVPDPTDSYTSGGFVGKPENDVLIDAAREYKIAREMDDSVLPSNAERIGILASLPAVFNGGILGFVFSPLKHLFSSEGEEFEVTHSTNLQSKPEKQIDEAAEPEKQVTDKKEPRTFATEAAAVRKKTAQLSHQKKYKEAVEIQEALLRVISEDGTENEKAAALFATTNLLSTEREVDGGSERENMILDRVLKHFETGLEKPLSKELAKMTSDTVGISRRPWFSWITALKG